jgi:hypothetical protein
MMATKRFGRKVCVKFAFPTDKLKRLLVINKSIGEMLEDYLKGENYKIEVSEKGQMRVYGMECGISEIGKIKSYVAEITELIKEEGTCFEAESLATYIEPKCNNQAYLHV